LNVVGIVSALAVEAGQADPAVKFIPGQGIGD
jgi:hypothetical protein